MIIGRKRKAEAAAATATADFLRRREEARQMGINKTDEHKVIQMLKNRDDAFTIKDNIIQTQTQDIHSLQTTLHTTRQQLNLSQQNMQKIVEQNDRFRDSYANCTCPGGGAAELAEARKQIISLKNRLNSSGPRISKIPYERMASSEKSRKLSLVKESVESCIYEQPSDGHITLHTNSLRLLLRDIWKEFSPFNSMELSLSVDKERELIELLQLRWHQVQTMGKFLRLNNINILNPWKTVYNAHMARVNQMQTFYTLQYIDLGIDAELTPMVSVKSVRSRFEFELGVFDAKYVNDIITDSFNNTLWLGIGLDKGGSTTKIVGTIMNTRYANSPHAIFLLGAYIQEETYDNISKCFGMILNECKAITSLKTADDRNIDVNWFFTGDQKVVNCVYGMNSCSARYPCVHCTWPKGTDRKDVVSRSQTHFRDMLLKFRDAQISTDRKVAKDPQWSSYNVVRKPLVHIEPTNICPPIVHLLLGPGSNLVSAIEGAAITQDLINAGIDIVVKNYDDRNRASNNYKNTVSKLKADSKSETEERSDIETIIHTLNRPISQNISNTCSSSHCILTKIGTAKINWSDAYCLLNCTNCKASIHFICTYLCTHTRDVSKEQTSYICHKCKDESHNTIRRRLEKRLDECDFEIQRLDTIVSNNISQTVVFENIIKCNGPCYRSLKYELNKLGVTRARYHQTYNGRQVGMVMRVQNLKKLFDSAQLTRAQNPDLWYAFVAFRRILKMAKPIFLDNNKLDKLQKLVDIFKERYNKCINESYESIKFHIMTEHLVEFANRFNMIGLFTEEALEHLHHQIDKSCERFKNAGPKDKQLLRAIVEREVTVHLHCEFDNVIAFHDYLYFRRSSFLDNEKRRRWR